MFGEVILRLFLVQMSFCGVQFAVMLLCIVNALGTPLLVKTTPHFIRAPAHDRAVIKSTRLGGNFAYSSVEGHAYAAIAPVVQKVTTPVVLSQTSNVPGISYYNNSAYAIESATLPKEHRAVDVMPLPVKKLATNRNN